MLPGSIPAYWHWHLQLGPRTAIVHQVPHICAYRMVILKYQV